MLPARSSAQTQWSISFLKQSLSVYLCQASSLICSPDCPRACLSCCLCLQNAGPVGTCHQLLGFTYLWHKGQPSHVLYSDFLQNASWVTAQFLIFRFCGCLRRRLETAGWLRALLFLQRTRVQFPAPDRHSQPFLTPALGPDASFDL